MNKVSSRSHCVFTCFLESRTVEDGVTNIRTSCLNLVDLAGKPLHNMLTYLILIAIHPHCLIIVSLAEV